jgi:hypothetical protein
MSGITLIIIIAYIIGLDISISIIIAIVNYIIIGIIYIVIRIERHLLIAFYHLSIVTIIILTRHTVQFVTRISLLIEKYFLSYLLLLWLFSLESRSREIPLTLSSRLMDMSILSWIILTLLLNVKVGSIVIVIISRLMTISNIKVLFLIKRGYIFSRVINAVIDNVIVIALNRFVIDHLLSNR